MTTQLKERNRDEDYSKSYAVEGFNRQRTTMNNQRAWEERSSCIETFQTQNPKAKKANTQPYH